MEQNKNDMERIQRGLEDFLYETENNTQKKTTRQPEVDIILERKTPRRTVIKEAEPELDIIGERPARKPQARRKVSQEELSLDLAQAKKELRDAKKVQREREKIDRMRREAQALREGSGTSKKNDKSPSKGKKPQEPKKKKTPGGLVFFISLLFLLALVWCYGMTKIYTKMKYSPTPALAGAEIKDDGVVNILLIGSDSRDDSVDGRSDAMILMSISNKTKTIQMTSLLRDMYVDIPGYEGNRLNAAYAFGGPELLVKTISNNLGIEVNRYVVVNFEAFANLVDAVGGVTLNLTNDEVYWVNAYLNEYNLLQGLPIDNDYLDPTLSGDILLDGPQALAFSRNRYIGTDFGRTERQRKVLGAVMKKLPGAMLKNPKGVIDGLFPNLTTNLSRGEFIYLSTMAWKLVAFDMEQNMIPQPGTYQDANIRGMAVLQVDFQKNIEFLKEKIYGK